MMGAPCEVAECAKRLVRFLLNSFIVCRVQNASGLSSRTSEHDSTTHHHRRQGRSISVLHPPALQTSIEYSHTTNRRSYKNEAHASAVNRVAVTCQETSSK